MCMRPALSKISAAGTARCVAQKLTPTMLSRRSRATTSFPVILNWYFSILLLTNMIRSLPDITVHVEGKSLKNEAISATDVGNFYDNLTNSDNHLRSRDNEGWMQLLANILILSMLLVTIVIVFKK